jgi:predicted enzyme related to lactoylglutathione lyase
MSATLRLLVNIDVPDLERAIAFYEAALPLRLSRRLFDGEVAELLGADARIYLLQKPAGSAAAPGGARRRFDRHWTPVHLDFVVDDLDTALADAATAGAQLETPPENLAWGRIAMLADPFGNGFCLVEFPGDPYG